MGVRLYNPFTGRFLSTDPVLGGSANPYDYTNQDPYNTFDFNGAFPLNIFDCPRLFGCRILSLTVSYGSWSRWKTDRVGSFIENAITLTWVSKREYRNRWANFTVRRYFSFNRRVQIVTYRYQEGRARLTMGWGYMSRTVTMPSVWNYFGFSARWA